MTSAPTSVFQDLAALSLYLFYAFFLGLVLWLHREGKREGYPLISDREGRELRAPIEGFPATPEPKTFRLAHGHGAVMAPGPRAERDMSSLLKAYDPFPGASQVPTGDPMQTGVGAASYSLRADTPDLTWDEAEAKIVPLRAAPGWYVPEGDPEIRGRPIFGTDKKIAGTVVDLWVDKSDVLLRYVEVEVVGSGKRVLIPLGLVHWSGDGPVKCDTASSAQIAAAPVTAHPERVTLREEDRISGYFGGGELHGEPGASEPFL
ncbi:photosynthetic reaction center subunit H [Falsiroseomonas oryzae]|uniref:photosynthetic reaction center subunit H n=1 Tax=Falsiroseomonas oryzae TaxID=2766473 RepID=UPI0022EA3A30|nr:photosynthetic reaction center subunit H [Roseomonas sp. MO-31]